MIFQQVAAIPARGFALRSPYPLAAEHWNQGHFAEWPLALAAPRPAGIAKQAAGLWAVNRQSLHLRQPCQFAVSEAGAGIVAGLAACLALGLVVGLASDQYWGPPVEQNPAEVLHLAAQRHLLPLWME